MRNISLQVPQILQAKKSESQGYPGPGVFKS